MIPRRSIPAGLSRAKNRSRVCSGAINDEDLGSQEVRGCLGRSIVGIGRRPRR